MAWNSVSQSPCFSLPSVRIDMCYLNPPSWLALFVSLFLENRICLSHKIKALCEQEHAFWCLCDHLIMGHLWGGGLRITSITPVCLSCNLESSWHCHPHFVNEEVGVQRGELICQSVGEPEVEPSQFGWINHYTYFPASDVWKRRKGFTGLDLKKFWLCGMWIRLAFRFHQVWEPYYELAGKRWGKEGWGSCGKHD